MLEPLTMNSEDILTQFIISCMMDLVMDLVKLMWQSESRCRLTDYGYEESHARKLSTIIRPGIDQNELTHPPIICAWSMDDAVQQIMALADHAAQCRLPELIVQLQVVVYYNIALLHDSKHANGRFVMRMHAWLVTRVRKCQVCSQD